jgi:hypothetical protein
MSSVPSSAFATEILVLALIVLVLARRTVRLVYGARFSVGRVFFFAGFYTLLFAALAFATLYSAVGDWGPNAYALLAPYVAIPVVAGFVAIPYVRRVVRFDQRPDGQTYFRLSWFVPVLYLVLFLARLVAEFIVLGPSALAFTIPPPAPSSVAALYVLISVDLLFGASLGLMVGRSAGVYLAHRDLPTEGTLGAPPPSPPLPSG